MSVRDRTESEDGDDRVDGLGAAQCSADSVGILRTEGEDDEGSVGFCEPGFVNPSANLGVHVGVGLESDVFGDFEAVKVSCAVAVALDVRVREDRRR